MTNETACKHSWFGQHGNIAVKKFKMMNLIKGKFCKNYIVSLNLNLQFFFSRMCNGKISNCETGRNHKCGENLVSICQRSATKDGEKKS